MNNIMDKDSPYYKQVSLLIRMLPVVATETVFALKGGTAINLFVRDFPRLSVDIDLAYLPLEPRDVKEPQHPLFGKTLGWRLNNEPRF